MKNDKTDSIKIRTALESDSRQIVDLLREAADWLIEHDVAMWNEDEIAFDGISNAVRQGQFHVAENAQQIVAATRLDLEDPLFWPEMLENDSVFVHRLVVSRTHAGCGISHVMLEHAVEWARSLGRRYLRLDCEASRPKLRALYEGFGMELHSYRQVDRFYVCRYEYRLQPIDR